MLLSQITPQYLTLSVFLLVLNIPLFLYGLKKQGKLFTFYAIFTVGVYSVAAWLITDVLPIDVTTASFTGCGFFFDNYMKNKNKCRKLYSFMI